MNQIQRDLIEQQLVGYAYGRAVGSKTLIASELTALDMVRAEMFSNKDYGTLFEIFNNGITDELQIRKHGVKMTKWLDCMTTTSQFPLLEAGLIHEWVEDWKYEYASKLLSTGQSVIEVADKMKSIEKTVAIEDNSVSVIQQFEKDEADLQLALKSNGLLGYSTGIPSLDKSTWGIQKKNIWVVGGYTGVGKSYLTFNIGLNVVAQGGTVMFVSLELPCSVMIKTMIGIKSGYGKFPYNLTPYQVDKYNATKADVLLAIQEGRLILYDQLRTPSDIIRAAEKANSQRKVDLVIIDHIQQIGGQGSFYERMSNASLSFQAMTSQLDSAVMIVSQISNEGQRDESFSTMSYKGAGEIASIADVGIRILRKHDENSADRAKYTDDYKIMLQKLRSGEPKTLDCKIVFPGGRVSEEGGLDSF